MADRTDYDDSDVAPRSNPKETQPHVPSGTMRDPAPASAQRNPADVPGSVDYPATGSSEELRDPDEISRGGSDTSNLGPDRYDRAIDSTLPVATPLNSPSNNANAGVPPIAAVPQRSPSISEQDYRDDREAGQSTAGTTAAAHDPSAHEHRDPLTGEHGAHPVGVGIGAAVGGAAIGAATYGAVGTVAGPVGTAIGAAIGAAVGAFAGGYAGKGAAEASSPTVEDNYWRDNYQERAYAKGHSYDELRPAYEYGWSSFEQHQGKSFDDVEPTLKRDWEASRSGTTLAWEKARQAVRDSWDRLAGHHRPANPNSPDAPTRH